MGPNASHFAKLEDGGRSAKLREPFAKFIESELILYTWRREVDYVKAF